MFWQDRLLKDMNQLLCSRVWDMNNMLKSIKRHEYYITHKEQELARNREWKDKHPEYKEGYIIDYRKTNRELINEKSRNTAFEQKKMVLTHYSNGELCCNICKINNIDVLTIDHINGGGNKERKKLNNKGGSAFYIWLIKNTFPKGYRVLCWNCNHLEHLKKINYKGAPTA